MKAQKRTERIGLPWPTWSVPPLVRHNRLPEQPPAVIYTREEIEEIKKQRRAERMAAKTAAQQEALIRAKRAGLSLRWLKGWDYLQLDEVEPTPPPRPESKSRTIVLATDHSLKPRKNQSSMHNIRVRIKEERDTSPGWENAVRAFEDSR